MIPLVLFALSDRHPSVNPHVFDKLYEGVVTAASDAAAGADSASANAVPGAADDQVAHQ